MASEIERIQRLLEKTFSKYPWYGKSIMETLQEIKPENTHQRTGQAHTITELVLHMAAWRHFVTTRLKGDEKFQVTDALNFPPAGTFAQALATLEKSQLEPTEALKNFPEQQLDTLVPPTRTTVQSDGGTEHRYTFYTLLHGVIQHDIYHLGQIAILNKTLR